MPPSSDGKSKRTPSIGGGLPLLLLSVLPPVIPRASWPSADHMQVPMRRSVTFSSQPHLDDPCASTNARLPAIDLLNLRLTHQQAAAERTGFLNRLRSFFLSSSRTASRKQSTTSINGGNGAAGGGGVNASGIAAALKAHMGLLSGLVPSAGNTSSCNALNTVSNKPLRRTSLVKSGTAINSTVEIIEPPLYMRPRHRKISTAFMISGGGGLRQSDECDELGEGGSSGCGFEEPHVNFQLPANRKPSICHQISQPTLRERVKGSPRFPHRILPTSSLNALEERGPEVHYIASGKFNNRCCACIITRLTLGIL